METVMSQVKNVTSLAQNLLALMWNIKASRFLYIQQQTHRIDTNLHRRHSAQTQVTLNKSNIFLQNTLEKVCEMAYQRRFPPLQERLFEYNRVRKLDHAVELTKVQQENERLIAFRKNQQRMEYQKICQSEAEMKCRWELALKEEQESAKKRRLQKLSVVQDQLRQIEEKRQQERLNRLQDRQEGERLRLLSRRYAAQKKMEAEKKEESRKSLLKHQLEDIAAAKEKRDREAHQLSLQDKETERAESELKNRLELRKNAQAAKLTQRLLPTKILSEKLALMKSEQAARVQREEAKVPREVAEEEAKVENQRKEKEEKRTSALRSIAAHREQTIQEKKQKEEAERKSHLEWLQAQKRSDILFREQERNKAQRIREERMKCNNFNMIQAAEKRAQAEQKKREEEKFEREMAKQAAERERQFQRCVQSELQRAVKEHRNTKPLLAARRAKQEAMQNCYSSNCQQNLISLIEQTVVNL
uniref:Trichohyalin-plectin-homology domain-containing protein n=1 Tax=Echeneis naucrates TaxID=173247 RepID=A0A665UMR1_ECHNA